MKTTEQGYLNKNNQRNNGKTNKQVQILDSGFMKWNVWIVDISIMLMEQIFGNVSVLSVKVEDHKHVECGKVPRFIT